MLHTISLAFKGVEYSQLCWKLNSLKPPFPLQQFIVGEFSVFAERLGLSRGWCQRAPIVPCSTAVSPPTTTSPHPHRLLLRLPTTFPFFFSWHSFCDREENFRAFISQDIFNFSCLWVVYSVVQEVQQTVPLLQNTDWGQGHEHSSHRLHIPVIISNPLNMPSHAKIGWQDKLYGWEIKGFGIALSQKSFCHPFTSSRPAGWHMIYDLKCDFHCQTQLAVPWRVLQGCRKMASVKGWDWEHDERVANIIIRQSIGV